MGEYSDFKPSDDLGQGDGDEELSAEQVAGYMGYGPSVPRGYPHGSFNEPDMGYDGPMSPARYSPRCDWARGDKEAYLEETIDVFEIGPAKAFTCGEIQLGPLFGRGDELECEP